VGCDGADGVAKLRLAKAAVDFGYNPASMGEPLDFGEGEEWVVDAFGCAPDVLRDGAALTAIFDRAVAELDLHPLGPARVHAFPGHGGVTALQLLTESHLTVHTFPERGYAAFNLYCCRVRPEWPWSERLAQALGAQRVQVRHLARGRAP
jgi:S-adenosylmethionine decarboxylase